MYLNKKNKMKKSIFVLLYFLTSICYGQITLEHTYTEGNVSRILLENSGEKYYITDETNKLIKLYNSDHSFWKTINLPTTMGATLNYVYQLSETKINTDSLIEVIYTYYVINGANWDYESRVINENGTTLLTIVGAGSLFLSELQGVSNKLIASFPGTTPTSKVYSVPSFNLEQTYSYDYLNRIILENSGEKYYVTDPINKQVQLYNADHSFWKTIDLPTTVGAILSGVSHISETKIINDSLIEVIYRYYSYNGGNIEYESRVINENGITLLTVPGAAGLFVSELQGAPNKLIAQIGLNLYSYIVYAVPSLILEHTYADNLTRTKLENSGEKYYVTDTINKQLKLYNADHSFWKAINLPTTTGASLDGFYHLSETKIATDNLIEVIYTYYTVNAGNLDFESRVINENGATLLTIAGARRFFISELQGLSNKLVFSLWGVPSSKVYGLPAIGSIGIRKVNQENSINIFPNPTSEFLYLTGVLDTKADKIKIYNVAGKCVLELMQNSNEPINISDLDKGIYFIMVHRVNDLLFHSKFIVI
jgi:hypothetical protein